MNHTIKICNGPHCGLKRANGENISEQLYRELKSRLGQRPDIDVYYHLCFDECELGNNIAIDDRVFNFTTIKGLDRLIKKYIDRPDDLAKVGLTGDEVDSILFK